MIFQHDPALVRREETSELWPLGYQVYKALCLYVEGEGDAELSWEIFSPHPPGTSSISSSPLLSIPSLQYTWGPEASTLPFLWADVLPPLQLMSHPAFLGLRPASEKYLGWRGSWFPGACWQNWPCVKMQMEEAIKKMLIWLLGTLIHVAHKTVIVFSTGVPCVSSAPPGSKIWGWSNTSSSFLLMLLFFPSKTLVLDWWKLHKGTALQPCLRSPCLLFNFRGTNELHLQEVHCLFMSLVFVSE